jgi:Cu2+-exporting ATPase
VVDKTGTITEGKPEVVEAMGLEDDAVASALLMIESRSKHPLAEAVYASQRLAGSVDPGLRHSPQRRRTGSTATDAATVTQFEDLTGKGVKATIHGTTWLVGNRRLLEEHGIAIGPEYRDAEKRWQEAAHTVIWFADAQAVRAAIAIADRIKPSAAGAIARLKDAGIKVYMQTGDSRRTAQAVAKAVGIDDFRSEVLPKDKAAFVTGLQQQGHVVAMVGDGINDSEALAKADVSIAMGQGSDIAMDVARMTLISTDLNTIPVPSRSRGRP